jgi:cytochrome c5
MSKIIHFIIVIAAITLACNKKALPTITERTKEPPPPAKKAVDVKPDLATGKIIFTNRCGNCHDLPKPEQYTARRWDGILLSMIPKARLNNEQGLHVTAYLKANAPK